MRAKADYICNRCKAGLNVLADKPMVITPADFAKLQAGVRDRRVESRLLYDIMTERYEITTVLQRELSQQPALFGELEKGSPDEPAITKESVHHFSKIVSGAPLKRPAWFFDVRQQGEGIVDVTTHLVDLVQWEAFPEQTLNPTDVEMIARAPLDHADHTRAIQAGHRSGIFSGISESRREGRNAAGRCANGEFTYRLRGVHAKVSVTWNFEAPPGAGDTHFSHDARNEGEPGDPAGRGTEVQTRALCRETARRATTIRLNACSRNAIDALQRKYPGRRFPARWPGMAGDRAGEIRHRPRSAFRRR